MAGPTVAVVGGGISGLTAAHRLHTTLGPEATVTVLEASDRVGGVLRTVELAGCAYDVGAEAFLARRPEMPALLAELGLSDEVVHPGTAAPTVLAAGAVRALPGGTILGVPSTAASLSGLVSPDALQYAASEPYRRWTWQDGADTTVGDLVRTRLGAEVVSRSVDPLLGGVYAGCADQLGVRATLPTLAAALDAGAPGVLAAAAAALPAPQPGVAVFGALRGGYAVLLDALATAANIRLRCAVTALSRTTAGWSVTVNGAPERFDAVVLAVPAPVLSTLLRPVCPASAGGLAEVEVASVAVVGLAYESLPELPETSGMLVASGEAVHAKAFTHSSRKWPHLWGGPVLLRASLGRAGGLQVLERPDEELLEQVHSDLAGVHGVRARPLESVVQRWPGGLPQYGPGHTELVGGLLDAVSQQPGLAVAGSVLHGVGVPACVSSGWEAAAQVAQHLMRRGGTGAPVAR